MIVVLSYRQTCRAYPNGGGAYAVSRANLGRNASLVAASALLVDYVLTVAVSVAAGVANIVSAVPSLADHAVLLSGALIVVLALMNLRGVKESGTIFAVPTYGFILCVFAMVALGLWRALSGAAPVAESSSIGVAPSSRRPASYWWSWFSAPSLHRRNVLLPGGRGFIPYYRLERAIQIAL